MMISVKEINLLTQDELSGYNNPQLYVFPNTVYTTLQDKTYVLTCERCGEDFNPSFSESDLLCQVCIDLIENRDSEIAANLHERGI